MYYFKTIYTIIDSLYLLKISSNKYVYFKKFETIMSSHFFLPFQYYCF